MTHLVGNPGDDILIHRTHGRKPLRSRNLRGIRSYASNVGVSKVVLDIVRASGQAYLKVTFADQSYSYAPFSDWRVMREFVNGRRSWRGCEIVDFLPLN